MDLISTEYKDWLIALKSKVRSAQIKAAVAVNSALIHFYWELGKMIAEKENVWGSKLIEQISKDLQTEFPEMKGLSATNLKYSKRFFEFYNSPIGQQPVDQLQISDNKSTELIQEFVGLIGQQPVAQLEPSENNQILLVLKHVAQIPWGHNIYVFTKSKNLNEAIFYIQRTIENNWSRDVLDIQIKSNLYNRQGKSINNFKQTLPEPQSDLAIQTLKDPYIFDLMGLTEGFKEKDIEKQMVQHITKFLLELGKGFAFIGQQYHLEIGDKDYYIDLLFYHTKLKCHIVIELKNTSFMPEYAGKLNFYLSAVDSLIKTDTDNATIGILLCKDKNNIEAEFALRGFGKPIGISEINFTGILPEELKSSLPTIEELESEFNSFN